MDFKFKSLISIYMLLSGFCFFPSDATYATTSSKQWQGLYIGAQAGAVWNRTEWHMNNPNYFNTLGAALLGSDYSYNKSSYSAGGIIGFNYLVNGWLLGVEGTFSNTDLKETDPSPYFPAIDTFRSEIDWHSSIKGKLGLTHGPWLGFVSGGWAGAQIEHTLSSTTGVKASSHEWANGWILGAGLDYQVSPNFILGLAYEYSDLDIQNESITCASCRVGIGFGTPNVNADISIQTLTLRAGYLFNI